MSEKTIRFITISLSVLIVVLLFTKIIKDHDSRLVGEISRIPEPANYVPNIESICLDGVKYYIINGFHKISISPALQQDGRPALCNKNLTPRKINDNDHP